MICKSCCCKASMSCGTCMLIKIQGWNKSSSHGHSHRKVFGVSLQYTTFWFWFICDQQLFFVVLLVQIFKKRECDHVISFSHEGCPGDVPTMIFVALVHTKLKGCVELNANTSVKTEDASRGADGPLWECLWWPRKTSLNTCGASCGRGIPELARSRECCELTQNIVSSRVLVI